jgi:hypothetical protein
MNGKCAFIEHFQRRRYILRILLQDRFVINLKFGLSQAGSGNVTCAVRLPTGLAFRAQLIVRFLLVSLISSTIF